MPGQTMTAQLARAIADELPARTIIEIARGWRIEDALTIHWDVDAGVLPALLAVRLDRLTGARLPGNRIAAATAAMRTATQIGLRRVAPAAMRPDTLT